MRYSTPHKTPKPEDGSGNVFILSPRRDNEVLNLSGYIKRTYPKPITTLPFGAFDFETYTLVDGKQRAYYLGIRHTETGFREFKLCDYPSERDYNRAIIEYFKRYPSIYFSHNGANFDSILMRRILSLSGLEPEVWGVGNEVRIMRWRKNIFLDNLYWSPPCSLSELAKTWLNEDLKGYFPHDAVNENMVKDKDSKFGKINIKDEDKEINKEDIKKFSNKPFWPLVLEYGRNDVDILYRSLLKLEKRYNEIGYSITDNSFQGIASIAHNHGLRYIKGNEFKCFDIGLYNRWIDCYTGGICEVNNLNLNQEKVFVYDINGLYTHVRLMNRYPVGEPKEMINPPVKDLNKLFGLVKAVVYNDGNIPLGIPFYHKASFERVKGTVLYRGTTEELKNLVRMGACIRKIECCLHYDNWRYGNELWGESIGVFEKIKQEGISEKNEGKRAFGKFCNNNSYGKYGLKWDRYKITSSNNTNLMIASFITSYARNELMDKIEYVYKNGGKLFYTDRIA